MEENKMGKFFQFVLLIAPLSIIIVVGSGCITFCNKSEHKEKQSTPLTESESNTLVEIANKLGVVVADEQALDVVAYDIKEMLAKTHICPDIEFTEDYIEGIKQMSDDEDDKKIDLMYDFIKQFAGKKFIVIEESK